MVKMYTVFTYRVKQEERQERVLTQSVIAYRDAIYRISKVADKDSILATSSY